MASVLATTNLRTNDARVLITVSMTNVIVVYI